jgi:hypothetical protein
MRQNLLTELRAGILGMSEGNGHPYSWAAICNGFDPVEMENCPFPGITAYLKKQEWPLDRLTEIKVTHIWTQDPLISESVSRASLIPNIVNNYTDLEEFTDIILLARDDAEYHVEMASGFLKKGMHVFIDKPFALSMEDAKKMLDQQVNNHQIFTCTSLRYAEEILLTKKDLAATGLIVQIKAKSPKYWKTYGVHLIEPIIKQFPERGKLLSVKKSSVTGFEIVKIKWQNLFAELTLTGLVGSSISFEYIGTENKVEKIFVDSFSCFKKSLEEFVRQIRIEQNVINREETLEVVQILEKGLI